MPSTCLTTVMSWGRATKEKCKISRHHWLTYTPNQNYCSKKTICRYKFNSLEKEYQVQLTFITTEARAKLGDSVFAKASVPTELLLQESDHVNLAFLPRNRHNWQCIWVSLKLFTESLEGLTQIKLSGNHRVSSPTEDQLDEDTGC